MNFLSEDYLIYFPLQKEYNITELALYELTLTNKSNEAPYCKEKSKTGSDSILNKENLGIPPNFQNIRTSLENNKSYSEISQNLFENDDDSYEFSRLNIESLGKIETLSQMKNEFDEMKITKGNGFFDLSVIAPKASPTRSPSNVFTNCNNSAISSPQNPYNDILSEPSLNSYYTSPVNTNNFILENDNSPINMTEMDDILSTNYNPSTVSDQDLLFPKKLDLLKKSIHSNEIFYDDDLTNWLRNKSSSFIKTSSTRDDSSLFERVLKSSFPFLNLTPQKLDGGILIVTSKSSIDKWANPIRSAKNEFSNISLEVYTQSLANRRKINLTRLSGVNVVITTFEILKAKEIVIPEESFENENSSENSNSIPWLRQRKRGGTEKGSHSE